MTRIPFHRLSEELAVPQERIDELIRRDMLGGETIDPRTQIPGYSAEDVRARLDVLSRIEGPERLESLRQRAQRSGRDSDMVRFLREKRQLQEQRASEAVPQVPDMETLAGEIEAQEKVVAELGAAGKLRRYAVERAKLQRLKDQLGNSWKEESRRPQADIEGDLEKAREAYSTTQYNPADRRSQAAMLQARQRVQDLEKELAEAQAAPPVPAPEPSKTTMDEVAEEFGNLAREASEGQERLTGLQSRLASLDAMEAEIAELRAELATSAS